jgi:hypothetical protein
MASEERKAWLLALGRGLRAEYDELVEPLSSCPRLAALVEQVEIAVQERTQEREGFRARVQESGEETCSFARVRVQRTPLCINDYPDRSIPSDAVHA